jgi:hypothetical protein
VVAADDPRVPLTLREKLIDLTLGSAAESCTPPTDPVRFGQKYWLAQHRWLEPVIGLVALLPVGIVYALGFLVLSRVAAFGLMAIWVAFVAGGLVLRVLRPCTVLRLPIHALLVWLIVVLTAGATGLTA